MGLIELKIAGIGYASVFAVMLLLGGVVLLTGFLLRGVRRGPDTDEKQ